LSIDDAMMRAVVLLALTLASVFASPAAARLAFNATPEDSGVSYWHGSIAGSNDGDAG
jgi:hypothetical protein